jgi:CRP-like cAMP-binding protein
MSSSLRTSLDRAWLFSELMDEEKSGLEKCLKSVNFAPGATVIAQGAPHAAIWIVVRGQLAVRLGGQTVGRLTEGEVFGEQAWLDGFAASASIVAESAVEVWQLSFKDFNAFLDAHADAHIHVLRKLAINLSQRLRQPKT